MVNETISPLLDSVNLLKDFGFFQVVLPLILIFAIVYGILIKTKIFGDPNEDAKLLPLYAIISFSMSFFVIASTDVVQMINEIVPTAATLLFVVFLMLILMGMFGFSPAMGNKNMTTWMKIMIIIMIVIFLGVIDMSMEHIQVPIVHDIASNFYDSGDDGGSGSGSGSDGGWSLTDQERSAAMGIFFFIAFFLGVFWIMIHYGTKSVAAKKKKSGSSPPSE